jgi:hypothetical protein
MSRPKSRRAPIGGDFPERLRTWKPAGWDDLVTAWNELLPEATKPDLEGTPSRRFRSYPVNNQEAGRVFERWIIDAFKLSGFEVEYPFTVPMLVGDQRGVSEELDGLVIDGWQAFLVQSKFWESRPVDYGPLAEFNDQVRRRTTTTLGLFFSAFPVSVPAAALASSLQPIRFLLFQRQDIDWAIERRDMRSLLALKWRCAVKYGKFDYEIGRDSD